MESQVKHIFHIGEEWVYYKLYCGKKTADDILLDSILPFAEQLYSENTISKWFFIRYNDPDFHIRLRFKLKDVSQFAIVIQELHNVIQPFLDSGFIWDVQIHQYKREVERYGNHTIDFCESLFFWDSVNILKSKQLHLSDEESIVFLIRFITLILDLFDFKTEDKFSFAERGRLGFKNEFNANKTTIKQLDKKNRVIIDKYKTSKKDTFSNILDDYQKQTTPVFKKIISSQNKDFIINDLAHSIIHMTINRYFNSNQRLYEFLIYDVLYKLYKTQYFKSVKQ